MPTPLSALRAIFCDALDCATEAARARFLDQACHGDPSLRAQVESLLAAHAAAGAPADATEEPNGVPAKWLPLSGVAMLGNYRLLEKIGEGGFGLVYLAEQHQPFHRRVAIKVLKEGMDTRQVIARFEAESQTLALMDHPNIAHVFDSGVTNGATGELASGRPYFVMELCQGIPITDYCTANAVPLKERLNLFIAVCQAVQHAHLKGIIHRDLKPSNVLVTVHDDRPLVKLIDFGIAKAIGDAGSISTLHTSMAQLIGTPLYMSPEQAAMNSADIDTRTDIYSLGVLLYELLTGTTPFEAGRLRHVSHDEMRRIIREEEPPRPSKRMRANESTAIMAHTNRVMHPGRSVIAQPSYLQELDWIVMKALEKDRNRRYETAGLLAADVQNYLNDASVLACPPSSWYRIRKFARRYRWPLALTGVGAAALVVIAIGAGVSALLLNQALHESENNRLQAVAAQEAAVAAETSSRERLYAVLRAKARASRFSHRVGQRYESLAALAEAAKIAREEAQAGNSSFAQTLDAHMGEMRNEAVAALALPDFQVHTEYDRHSSPSFTVYDFDDKLARFAGLDARGQIRVRRLADDRELSSWQVRPGSALLELSRDGRFLAAGQANDRLGLWRLDPNPRRILHRSDFEISWAFSPDNRYFAMVDTRHAIRIFDLSSGAERWKLSLNKPVRALEFAGHGPYLALATEGTVQVRDFETGQCVARFLKPRMNFWCLAWHPEGNVLAAVSMPTTDEDAIIYLWDIARDKEVGKLEGLRNGGFRLAFSHGGDLLVSTGWEGVLRLWDWRAGRELFSTHTNFLSANPPRFSRDDRLLAAEQRGKSLFLWKISGGREYRTLVRDATLGPTRYLWGLAVDPTGRLLAAGMEDGVCFWDLKCGQQVGFAPLNGRVTSVSFERSGALWTFGDPGLMRWPTARADLPSGQAEAMRLGPTQKLSLPGTFRVAAASADGSVIASPQGTQPALVWHRGAPEHVVELRVQSDVRLIAVSPSGRWVATGKFGGSGPGAQVWNAHTGERIANLPVDSFCSVAFSPDKKWLATVTRQGDVRFWSVGSWQQKSPPVPACRATTELQASCFSPDSAFLAVPLSSGVIRLIDVNTGKDLAQLDDPTQDVASALAFSPDGTLLAAASQSARSLHVWDLAAIRRELALRRFDWGPTPAVPSTQDSCKSIKLELDLGSITANRDAWLNQGEWDKLAAAFDRLIKTNPDIPGYWMDCAGLHLRLGDARGYREVCRRMLKQFGKSTGLEDLALLAHTLALGPQAVADTTLVAKLAEQRLARTQSTFHQVWSWHVLGLAYYRSGQSDRAIQCLQRCIQDNPDWSFTILNELVLAMAHKRLGHMGEARRWLETARQHIAIESQGRWGFAPPGWFWRNWLLVDLLHREAGNMIDDSPT